MKQSKSSKAWLAEHRNDPYVKQARALGLRSRAAFKLMEIQEKYQLIKPGMRVVELGAAPGGWSECVVKWVQPRGSVYALDILAMEPIAGVTFIQGDMEAEEVLHTLLQALNGQGADLVLSDMAPNMSGNDTTDAARVCRLADCAIETAGLILASGGSLLLKLFQGPGFDAVVKMVREQYGKIQVLKPKASRARSNEVYLLASFKK